MAADLRSAESTAAPPAADGGTGGSAPGDGDAAGAAERMSRVLSGTLSMLAHDLRTPLSAMTTWLYLLESDKLDPAARKQALRKIRANVEDQVQLIDDAPVALQLPPNVVLEVVDTPPELKGGTATKRPKPAKLNTGLEIMVPEYIVNGEKIYVSTLTGEFNGRV